MKAFQKNKVFGIYRLFRAIPVLTFSGSLLLINIGFAAKYESVIWFHAVPMVAGVFLINGFFGHSLNDINDWLTGTDKMSKGILSGGSKVLKEGLLSRRDLHLIAFVSLIIIWLIGLYLYLFRGFIVIAALLIGIMAAWAYSCPPFRLAHKPFLGELLCIGLPGIVISAASYFVLTGSFHILPFFAGLVQNIMLLGWIMQHHIPDISADIMAVPRKLTTPALFYMLWGPRASIIPSLGYFLTAGILCIFGYLHIHTAFMWTLLPCAAGIWAGVNCDTFDVGDVTKKELITAAFVALNSFLFVLTV